MKIEEILRQQPFHHILRIVKAESLEGTAASSGETFKIWGNNGKVYKLRYADGLLNAREMERNVKAFPQMFPKFYGREGRYLLFDWVEGRTLSLGDTDPQIYRKLGEFCADVHNANLIKSGSANRFFFLQLNAIPETILTKDQRVKVIQKYESLIEKIDYDLIIDLQDMHARNFIIDKKNRIYLVDEDALVHRIKGAGIAKAFLRWIATPEKRQAFWQGYTSKHSNDYFDKEYEMLVNIVEYVRGISSGVARNDKYTIESYLEALRTLCDF